MRFLALLLFTATASAQDPTLPQEPTIYVVTASWCAPCQRFRRDWDTVPGFARLVGTNYAVKKCDWDRPQDQRWARRMGVSQMPTYIVVHRNRVVAMWSGYDGNWQDWLRRVDLDEYIVDGMLVPSHPEREPGWQQPARPQQQPQTQQPQQPTAPPVNLSPINDRLGNLEQLIRELSTQPQPRPPETQAESPKPPVVSQPATQDAAPAGSLNGWKAVMDAAVQLGLIAAAPQVALPAGVLGVAGMLYRAWRSKRGNNAQEPRQIVRQETVREVPVVVTTQSPPPAARVVETVTHVPVENDAHRRAFNEASKRVIADYPGQSGTIEYLRSMIKQIEDGERAAKGTNNAGQ
jgi:hypothetical protein